MKNQDLNENVDFISCISILKKLNVNHIIVPYYVFDTVNNIKGKDNKNYIKNCNCKLVDKVAVKILDNNQVSQNVLAWLVSI